MLPTRKKVVERVLAILSVLFLVATVQVSQSPSANAADLSQFDPGLIISDDQFWDSASMSENEIQNFLASKVANCRTGYTCLKDYRESTRSMDATPMCSFYQGSPNELASTIIAKVARSCGVSPKVLLVMLQKEQGLVTDTWPVDVQYRSAMGAGCPDTAACDSDYYGFFNQVHYGAYLLKRYTQPPGTGPGTAWPTRFDLRYPVGETTPILYNPNAACGTKDVLIQSQATHALYIYTPYTPNQAALLAGYGTGDGCSAYGNRNFFNYYSDWFGNPKGYAITGLIKTAFDELGGTSGLPGRPVSNFSCGLPNNGCSQAFTNGNFYLNPNTGGAKFLTHAAIGAWDRAGGPAGSIGYPIEHISCNSAGSACSQQFQGGEIFISGNISHFMFSPIATLWNQKGAQSGLLGIPETDSICILRDKGCFQAFTNAYVVSNGPSKSFVLMPSVWNYWHSIGAQDGVLGYPISQPSTTGENYTQIFEGGTIAVSQGVPSITSNTNRNLNIPDGSFIKSEQSPTVFQILGKSKIPIGSWGTLLALTNQTAPNILNVSRANLDQFSTQNSELSPLKFGRNLQGVWSPGSFVKGSSSPIVYQVSGGILRAIPSWQALLALNNGNVPTINLVDQSIIDATPKGLTGQLGNQASAQPILPASANLSINSLIKSTYSPTVYLVNELGIQPIASWAVLVGIVGTTPSITIVDQSLIESLQQLSTLNSPMQAVKLSNSNWGFGKYIKSSTSPVVYWIQGNCLRPVSDWQHMLSINLGQSISIATVSADLIRSTDICLPASSSSNTKPDLSNYEMTNIPVGSFIKVANSDTVYVVSLPDIRPIASWDVLTSIANSPNPNIITVTQDQLVSLNISGEITSPIASGIAISGVWSNKSLIKSNNSDIVYVVSGDQIRPISSWSKLVSFANTNSPQINNVSQSLIDGSAKGTLI